MRPPLGSLTPEHCLEIRVCRYLAALHYFNDAEGFEKTGFCKMQKIEKTKMRLSQHEIQSIKDVVYSLDGNARIYLFGSRVYDDKRGGRYRPVNSIKQANK